MAAPTNGSPLGSLFDRALTRRSLFAGGIGAAAVGLLAACSTDSVAAGGAGGKAGGTLVYLDAEVPTSAQVQESGTWQTRALQQNITDRLINRNPKTYELEPWLAESWTVSADGLDYVFVIRDGVTYSDGQALDVASVKKNLEWQVSGDEAKGVSANSQFPRKVTVTTDEAKREVHVHLDTPYAAFLNVLTSWSAGLVADKTIDASHEAQAKFVNLIGSGPFVVESEKYAQQIVLERRKGYAWAPKSAANQGEAKLATLTWVPTEEDSVRLGTVQSGQAGVLRYVEPSEEAPLEKQDYDIVAGTGVGLSNQWFLRPGVAPFDDVRVRKAVFRAIDRTAILQQIYTEHWSAATSQLAPNTFGYRDVSAAFSYDADAAGKLLDEAGWTATDSKGYRTKGGKRLHLKTYIDVYDNTAKSLFQAVQAQFKDIGIELELGELDYSSYWNTAFNDKEVGFLRVGWPHPDPGVGLAEYYSKDGSDLLQLKGSDTTLQSLLDRQAVTVDESARADLLGQIQQHLVDQAYVLPILNDSQVFVVRPGVSGFTLSDGALPLYGNVSTS